MYPVLQIQHSRFLGNIGRLAGGAILVGAVDGAAYISDVEFEDNHAGQWYGGAFVATAISIFIAFVTL